MLLLSLLVLQITVTPSISAATHTRYEGKETKEVIKAAENHDPSAVEELGVRKEKSSVNLLKQIADEPDVVEPAAKDRPSWKESKAALKAQWRNASHVSAKIALAKMGEGRYVDEFLAGLASSDPERKAKCIRHLGEIGDRRAVKALIPILDDNQAPPRKKKGHVRSPTYAMMATDSLSRILPDVESQFLADSKGKGYVPIQAWKAWWEKNKDQFEKK